MTKFVQLVSRQMFDHRILILEDGGYYISEGINHKIAFHVKKGKVIIDKMENTS